MAVKSLREINETRNIESSIDENTLSSGETSGGFFGTFKIFEAVKKAVNWLTNITGNKTFEGNVQINGTLKSNNYSSNEKCIGTWINGKPLYRKIVVIANVGANLTNDIAHGISNLDQITNSFIVLYSGNGNFYPLPWTHSGYAGYQITRQYISFWFSSSWNGNKGLATLEYTKTTD